MLMYDSDFEIDAWFHGFLGSFGGQGLVSHIVGARKTTAIMVYKWDDRSKRDEGSAK